MAAFASSSAVLDPTVDIDLTVDDTDSRDVKMHIDRNAGSTADKPIELDLDAMDIDMAMTDLFGDAADTNSTDVTTVDGLFSPVAGDIDMAGEVAIKQEDDKVERSFLDTLGPINNDDIFATLVAEADSTQPLPEKTTLSLQSAPSPGALLASFSSSQLQDVDASSADNINTSGGEAQFDLNSLDLSTLSPGFFGNGSESNMGFSMDMEDFLNMGGGNEDKEGSKPEPA
jgi:hypothetical protein